MLIRRKLLLLAVLVLCGGSVWGSLAYGLYLRSDRYRHSIEADLTAFLQLPAAIGRVQPLTRYELLAEQVQVWLPGSKTEIFRCQQAVWQAHRDEHDRYHALVLRDGRFFIDSGQWSRRDYRRVLESGLGHDFADLRLEEVRVHNLDFIWRSNDFTLTTRQTSGVILFQDDDRGRATLDSRSLNDHPLEQPLHIHARFRTTPIITIEEVELEVPPVPLGVLKLDRLVGATTTTGSFAGRVIYREREDRADTVLSGFVEDVLLAEVTAPWLPTPITGGASLYIDHAGVVEQDLKRLKFRGQLNDVALSTVFPLIRIPDAGGVASLEIHLAEIADDRIGELRLSGRADDLSLATLCNLLGRGSITGTLNVRLHQLRMKDNRLLSAELDVTAVPPPGEAGWIDKALLQTVAEQVLGFPVPDIIPDRVEYTKLGAKLLLEGGRLRVLGTHGKNNNAILSVRLFGREVGVLYQPSRSYDVQPWIDQLTEQLNRLHPDVVRDWTARPEMF